MRKALVWLGGALGFAALYRLLRRRQVAEIAPAPVADPAEELKRTLAETRAGEEPAAEPEADPTSLDERRRRVHERAQEAIDAMREPPAE